MKTPRSRRLQPEMIVAISAVVLGVCALVVSVVQVRMMHEQQHASVWPRLVIMPSFYEAGLLIEVSNPGIGPAVIRHVRTTVDGAPRRDWSAALAALAPGQPVPQTVYSTISDRIIPPGESVRALHISDAAAAMPFFREIGRLDVEICYCSVYDRCWTVSAYFVRRAIPREVGSCPGEDAETFAN